MGWLGSWAHRVKITADGTDITANLTQFPILIHLSVSCGISSQDLTFVFDELGANSKKIAVTTNDGTTQCYVEIDLWNAVTEEAWLWVSLSTWTLTSGVNEDFYLYYDVAQPDNDTYVGLPNSIVAENVWDANYVLVSHMNDDPDTSHVRDSTSNDNDGAKKAANEPIEIAGKIGKAQSYDGTNDYVNCGSGASLDLDYVSFSAWCAPEAVGQDDYAGIIGESVACSFYMIRHSTAGKWCGVIKQGGISYIAYDNVAYNSYAGAWVFFVCTYDGETVRFYKNGVLVDSNVNPSGVMNKLGVSNKLIGLHAEYYFSGKIDEVRIYNRAFGVAEIFASYETQRDNFLTFGSEENIILAYATFLT